MPETKFHATLRVAHPKAAAVAKKHGYEAVADDDGEYVAKKVPVILTESELAELREAEPWAVCEGWREATSDDEAAVAGKVESVKKRASKGASLKAKASAKAAEGTSADE